MLIRTAIPNTSSDNLGEKAGRPLFSMGDVHDALRRAGVFTPLCDFVRLRNSLNVHVSFLPKPPTRLLGRAEAGEFGGNGFQAFEDIAIVGFLGRGLFGEETNRAAGFEYGAVDQIE